MVERRIGEQLQPIAARMRRLWFSILLSAIWIFIAALGLALALAAERAQASPALSPIVLALIAVIALVMTYVYCWRRARDFRRIAHYIEKFYPDLNARLLTALEQQPANDSGMYSFLQETVIREALHHNYRHRWYRAVPGNQLALAYVACFVSLVLVCAASWRLSVAARPFSDQTARAGVQIYGDGERAKYIVDPGDVQVERGTSLLVTVRFLTAPPPEVTLIAHEVGGTRQLKMTRSLDDPLFGARFDRIEEPFTYSIDLGRSRSDEFSVDVFDYPRLERVDAELIYPSYTNLENKQLADVRRITAVEAAQVKLRCYMNKPLAIATLNASSGEKLRLQSSTEEPFVYSAVMDLKQSDRWQFSLQDAEGRTHKKPPAELTIQVTANQPPDLKWVAPGRDMRVSPLEEILIAGTVYDDFGVVRHGLSFRHADNDVTDNDVTDNDVTDVELGKDSAGGQRHPLQHVLELEKLNAQPDELLSYFLWAEDVGPDGKPRRVYSDMYFGEVRPFEEIFRQGQSQGDQSQQNQQQGGGAGQQAEELAQLQKQIIQGTWNLIRRETGARPTDAYSDDVQVLRDSQQTAIEQLTAMGGQVVDARSLLHLETAKQAMTESLKHLEDATTKNQTNPIRMALPAEQSAYQALLSLGAREHEVVRGRQQSSSGSAGGSSSRAQQELQQLELNDDQNRYETERAAQTDNPMQQELRQGLNRLRELARRQGDLNERLKELQSALQQANTEEKRKELEEQLKRLREEQEEILRDTDELQQRLEQPQNQEKLAEQREQLANTREDVRQTSEALEEGRLSQAITSGTRAERELKDLQEDFRRQTSNQFAEEMREMRQQARQLSDDQQQIGNELNELVDQEASSLRPSERREQLEQALDHQQDRVDKLLESIRETVQEAEQDEPLLSRKLYDTYRLTQQDNPQQSLQQASQWMEQGFPDQAQQPEQQARAGIERFAERVDDAARGILGDEAEALRRARDELDNLAEQLAQEMERNNPDSAGQATNQPEDNADTQPARASNSQQQSNENSLDQSSSQQTTDQRNQQQSNSEQSESQQQGSPGQQGTQQGSEQSENSEEQNQSQQDSQQQGAGQQSSQQQGSQQQGSQQQSSQQQSSQQSQQQGSQRSQQQSRADQQTDQRSADRLGSTGPGGDEQWLEQMVDRVDQADQTLAPLTGDTYRQWSDRLRDVEEMLDDPDLRAEAARIRDRARQMRIEWKRHSKLPEWQLVGQDVQRPLIELRDRIAEELRRRSSEKELAPVDRDPVPTEFEEHVRRYYQQLGSGKQ